MTDNLEEIASVSYGEKYPNGVYRSKMYVSHDSSLLTDYFDEDGRKIRSKHENTEGDIEERFYDKNGTLILLKSYEARSQTKKYTLFYPDGKKRRETIIDQPGKYNVVNYGKNGETIDFKRFSSEYLYHCIYYPWGGCKEQHKIFPDQSTLDEFYSEDDILISRSGKLPHNTGTFTCVINEEGFVRELRKTFFSGGYEYISYNNKGNVTKQEGVLENKLGTYVKEREEFGWRIAYSFYSGEEKIVHADSSGVAKLFTGCLANNEGVYSGSCWANGIVKNIVLTYKNAPRKELNFNELGHEIDLTKAKQMQVLGSKSKRFKKNKGVKQANIMPIGDLVTFIQDGYRTRGN